MEVETSAESPDNPLNDWVSSPGLDADPPGHLSPVVVAEALPVRPISALLHPELPAVGLLLAEPQGVALVLIGVGVAHVLETRVAVSLLRERPQLM